MLEPDLKERQTAGRREEETICAYSPVTSYINSQSMGKVPGRVVIKLQTGETVYSTFVCSDSINFALCFAFPKSWKLPLERLARTSDGLHHTGEVLRWLLRFDELSIGGIPSGRISVGQVSH